MFISLRKYLETRPEQLAPALLRMSRLLLEALEQYSVKGDANDYEAFRTEIRTVLASLAGTPAASEILVAAGRTVKAVEQYNSGTTKFLQVQCSELQLMIAMLTKTMATLAAGSQASISQLQDIERQLQGASQLEDFQSAKKRMSDCLNGLRSEIVRQREQSSRQVTELRTAVERTNERTASRTNREVRSDPLTGLPERAAAEAALAAAIDEGNQVSVAVFFIERLDLINARFGHEAGDQILLFFHEQVSRALQNGERLFRWTGPALLAILDRDEPTQQIREQLSRVITPRLSKNINVGNRSVLLPIHSNWMVFAVHEVRPFSELLRKIDGFVHGAPETKAANAV